MDCAPGVSYCTVPVAVGSLVGAVTLKVGSTTPNFTSFSPVLAATCCAAPSSTDASGSAGGMSRCAFRYFTAAMMAAVANVPSAMRPTAVQLTEEGFSPLQAAGFQPRRLRVCGLRQQSRGTTGLSPRCEHGCQDTLHLATRSVFAGSVVHRSHGEKHERALDEVRSA
jgi:hypothetical protein